MIETAPSRTTPPLLEVRGLGVAFRAGGETVPVVRDLSFSMQAGDRVALAGESGCGKSMTCMALMRLPPTDRAIVSGEVLFRGVSLTRDAAALARVRGRRVAYVFQDPAASLNPVMRVGAQLGEVMRRERPAEADARLRAAELLARVRLPDPAAVLRAYPCELSGGMQQRVMLAMALAAEPELLVADEPTTALDVTTQAEVLDLVDALVRENGLALLLVTHNLGLIAGRCRTIHVMYAGQIIESGPVAEVLRHPAHPYTEGLLRAVPTLDRAQELRDIPGTVPAPDELPSGCAFAPRCTRRAPACDEPPPNTGLTPSRNCRCWRPLGADAGREGITT
ncbi:MAG: ABC transporter ATP-binding protein [Kiritimatiellae bacterium]|nr:ABC transporter ATP-binding protein [Kiritimatiellia bacterium]